MLMIVIGIPGLLTAKGFFSLLFEKGIRYDMTPHNIYRFSLPICSQQTLDVTAV